MPFAAKRETDCTWKELGNSVWFPKDLTWRGLSNSEGPTHFSVAFRGGKQSTDFKLYFYISKTYIFIPTCRSMTLCKVVWFGLKMQDAFAQARQKDAGFLKQGIFNFNSKGLKATVDEILPTSSLYIYISLIMYIYIWSRYLLGLFRWFLI